MPVTWVSWSMATVTAVPAARAVQSLDDGERVAGHVAVDRDGSDDLRLVERDVQPRAVGLAIREPLDHAEDLTVGGGDAGAAGADRVERVSAGEPGVEREEAAVGVAE